MGQSVIRRCVALVAAALFCFTYTPGHAQTTSPLPTPHLGYGIHVAPNVPPDVDFVNALGMDWVKIYDLGQAGLYPDKHILYRMDLHWPENWPQFKTDVETRAGALAGLHIDAVEVGNEPNLVNEWVRSPNAWEYVQMLRVAYTAIKAVNPNLIVVSAGLAPTLGTPDHTALNDLDFAKEMLDNGAGQWLDAFGYHPYGYNLPPDADPTQHELVFRRTERIHDLLEAHNVHKQIWLTEFGWLRDPAEDGVTCADDNPDFRGFAWLRVSGQQQADYLVGAFQYADQNWPWAGPTFVWNLNWNQMGWLGVCNHQRWFGLLKANGSPAPAIARLSAMPHRYSDYTPQLTLHVDSLAATVPLACLHRIPLGTFSIENTGYPANVTLRIDPLNDGTPPFVDVQPNTAHPGDPIAVFADPTGIKTAGVYTIIVNVRGSVNKRNFSQSVQGQLDVSPAALCHS
jgi:hypothetical protein